MVEIADLYEEGNGRATLRLGRQDLTGHFTMSAYLRTGPNQQVQETIVTIDLDAMVMRLGSVQQLGGFMLLDLETVQIDAKTSSIVITGQPRHHATLTMISERGWPTIFADADTGQLQVGGTETPGELHVRDGFRSPNTTIFGSGAEGRLVVGGGDTVGRVELAERSETRAVFDAVEGLTLKSDTGADIIALSASNGTVTVGGVGRAGTLEICEDGGQPRISMDGEAGDIWFAAADLAEDFTVAADAVSGVEPGMVMVLDDHGSIVPCTKAYDQRVVGVVAGAGDYRPAMILDRQDGPDRRPIAMIGKAFCRVTAANGAIAIGDLLTTSDVPGHAQLASDKSRAAGCVIGKALATLPDGQGLLPVLVNLQ